MFVMYSEFYFPSLSEARAARRAVRAFDCVVDTVFSITCLGNVGVCRCYGVNAWIFRRVMVGRFSKEIKHVSAL